MFAGMLKSLQIKNYVLIDSLDIEFPAGLIIITGQTGAGKSILLGALSLVLGGKADPSTIGSNGDNCVVEAEFEGVDESIRDIFDENELPWDGGNMVIRRVLGVSGRSRSFVNDEPVSQKILAQIASRLIDIHSQHDTLLLNDKSFQLSMLDHYAGNVDLLSECRSSYDRLCSLRKCHADMQERLRKSLETRDYNQARYQRLEDAALRIGELEELESEQKRLANAEEIRTNLFAVMNGLAPDDEDLISLDTALKDSTKSLNKISDYVPSAASLAERIESARLELDDVLSEVSGLAASVEVSDTRLQEVESRMSLIYDLFSKYSCADEAELIATRDSLAASVSDADNLAEELASLSKEIEGAQSAYDSVSAQLHDRRNAAVGKFSDDITQSVRSLELERSVFQVKLHDGAPSRTGKDEIQFLFSSTGNGATDISKCASGGELSRIMLCLKAMMAHYTAMPTLIFDEIDTGVSGSVADKMGTMICSMGSDMQVFAITHLPQVAAKGNAHYLVEKNFEGDTAVSTIRRISGDERVQEIARMLSGSNITDAAIANAKSLLS